MVIKRLFDIIFSFFLLVFLSPLLLVIFILIPVDSRGPIIFKQTRIGKDKREFTLYKFRTMVPDTEAEKSLDFNKDTIRTTKLGKLLRRTKFDEFPQLINVLVGDMSIVGPRPTLKYQVESYNEHQMKRLNVKPGLTGLVQVSGGTMMSWPERIELDIFYIENMSFLLDLKIIIKTIAVVAFGEGILFKR